MDTDDLEPRVPKPASQGFGSKDLDDMSIEALRDYIAELRTEIERAEAAVDAKHAARAGAEAFFKS